jgi:hypothetical protein
MGLLGSAQKAIDGMVQQDKSRAAASMTAAWDSMLRLSLLF